MRGIWVSVARAGTLVLLFGGTVSAVDNFRCHDPFYTVVVDSGLDSRAKDYIVPIRSTKPFLHNRNCDVSKFRELSDMWIGLAKQGKLSQIYPGYYGESLIDGPKSDIFMTCTGLANKISEASENELNSGDPNALTDAIRAIELIDIVRFGSYESLFTSSGYMRRPLKVLRPNLNHLTDNQRSRLARVQDPKTRDSKTQMLDEVSRRLKMQYASRYGDEMTKQDDPSYASYQRKGGSQVAAEHFYGFDKELDVKTASK